MSMKSATEQYYEGLLREKNRNAWAGVSKQIGEVAAEPVKVDMFKAGEAKEAESAQYDEELQRREEVARVDGVARAWKSFGSDIAHAVNEGL